MTEPLPKDSPRRRTWGFAPKKYLRRMEGASLMVQGAWMALRCRLWEEKKDSLVLAVEELCRAWNTPLSETRLIIAELQQRGVIEAVVEWDQVQVSIPRPAPRKRAAGSSVHPGRTGETTPQKPVTSDDVQRLVTVFGRGVSKHPFRIALEFASHLTRHTWEELCQAADRVIHGGRRSLEEELAQAAKACPRPRSSRGPGDEGPRTTDDAAASPVPKAILSAADRARIVAEADAAMRRALWPPSAA